MDGTTNVNESVQENTPVAEQSNEEKVAVPTDTTEGETAPVTETTEPVVETTEPNQETQQSNETVTETTETAPAPETTTEVALEETPENPPEVTTETSAPVVEEESAAETTEPIATITPAVEEELTEDEKIISNWLENGKTEVSTNELSEAGLNKDGNVDSYSFEVGRFKLSRMMLVKPYKIERK